MLNTVKLLNTVISTIPTVQKRDWIRALWSQALNYPHVPSSTSSSGSTGLVWHFFTLQMRFILLGFRQQHLSLSQEMFLSSGEKLATPGHGSSDPGPWDKIKHSVKGSSLMVKGAQALCSDTAIQDQVDQSHSKCVLS